MSESTPKGRLHWLIPILDLLILIIYLVIGFGGLMNAFSRMDFAGMFQSVQTAIIFVMVATIVVTVLCFLPVFKSKFNKRIAIFNIIWLALTIIGLI